MTEELQLAKNRESIELELEEAKQIEDRRQRIKAIESTFPLGECIISYMWLMKENYEAYKETKSFDDVARARMYFNQFMRSSFEGHVRCPFAREFNNHDFFEQGREICREYAKREKMIKDLERGLRDLD
jgi:hypothetical protein